MRDELDPEWAQLASELALGVLEGEERAEAQRLYLMNPRFAEAVDDWRLRLGVLLEQAAEEEPPSRVWQAIEARLPNQNTAEVIVKLGFWRRAALGATAVAAVLGLALLSPLLTGKVQAPPASQDQFAVASLKGASGAVLAARYATEASELKIRSVDVRAGDKAPELWIIPADGIPRSLGIISASGTTRIAVPKSLQAFLVDGATLAVSLETIEGAPHKAPSSTPIATGTISVI